MRHLTVRPPAVAGTFYPDDPARLESMIEHFLQDVHLEDDLTQPDMPLVKAVIAPHAGYVYSGPTAAVAIAHLAASDVPIRRFVLLGPVHYVHVRGIAVSSAAAFDTPLGSIRIDDDARQIALGMPGVGVSDEAHAPEHSLEVELPFLQVVCPDFTIVPLLVGAARPEEVAAVLEALWGDGSTRFVISSDLSHYHTQRTAEMLDRETAAAIEALNADAIFEESACGRIPIRGLLLEARARGLLAETVDLRTSGDTGGPRDRVVGYGAFTFTEPAA